MTFARKAAEALGNRLQVAAFNPWHGCPACHEAEAREFLAKLQRIASENPGGERKRFQ